MKNKALVILIIFFTYLQDNGAQNIKNIIFVDENSSEPISFLLVYSDCNEKDVFLTNESGKTEISYINTCKHYKTSHINYINTYIILDSLKKTDTIKLKPNNILIDSVMIVSKKIDNQYLYDLLNGIIKNYRNNTIDKSLNYLYVLNSRFEDILIENIVAKIETHYIPKFGFNPTKNNLIEGRFLFANDAIFLNLDTEKLVLSYNPISFKNDNFQTPLNQKKITKKNTIVKLANCHDCNENEILIELIKKDDKSHGIVKIDKVNNKIIEYKFYLKEVNNSYLRSILNDFPVNIEDLYIKYILCAENQTIELIEFVFDIKMENDLNVKVRGFLKNNPNDTLKPFNILGKYNSDNIYEEIVLSLPNRQSESFDKNLSDIQNTADKKDWSMLSSYDISVQDVFLNLPSSQNSFIVNGKNRIKSTLYKIHVVPQEYWFYKYEKQLTNYSFLNFNWVYKFTKDSIYSMPTLYNTKTSKIYSRIIDTSYFNFCTNLIFDFIESKRLELFDSISMDSVLLDNTHEINYHIVQQFEKVNEEAQKFFIEMVENKLGFQSIDDMNSIIINKIGIDNLVNYFYEEIPVVIEKTKESKIQYNSVIDSYFNAGLNFKKRNAVFSSYYFERALYLYELLIKEYLNYPAIDNKILGSFYGRKAEALIELNRTDDACSCLKNKYKFWPESLYVVTKLSIFYNKNCR